MALRQEVDGPTARESNLSALPVDRNFRTPITGDSRGVTVSPPESIHTYCALFPPDEYFTCLSTFSLCGVLFCKASSLTAALGTRVWCPHGRDWTSVSGQELKPSFEPLRTEATRDLLCILASVSCGPSSPLSNIFRATRGFPGGAVVKNLQCGRHRRCGFDPWARKIPWRRAWQPTPVFLTGESHGQGSLVGYSPWGHTESDTTEHDRDI